MKILLRETQLRYIVKDMINEEPSIGDYAKQYVGIVNNHDGILNKLMKGDYNTPQPSSNNSDDNYSSAPDSPSPNNRLMDINKKMSNSKILDIHPFKNQSPKISSHYGRRSRGNHKGIDFAVPSGTEVIAPADGEVISARNAAARCGGFVKIQHGEYLTKYCHLKQWFVKVGQQVKKGDVIGYSGGAKTDPFHGNSTGPHLHYELLYQNKHIDPLSVIS